MSWITVQAGNRASKTRHYSQWRDSKLERNAVISASQHTCNIILLSFCSLGFMPFGPTQNCEHALPPCKLEFCLWLMLWKWHCTCSKDDVHKLFFNTCKFEFCLWLMLWKLHCPCSKDDVQKLFFDIDYTIGHQPHTPFVGGGSLCNIGRG